MAFGALLCAQPPAAHAQRATETPPPSTAAVRSYDIPPGPLGDALNQFARQAGLALSFPPGQVEGKVSSGLRGNHSPQAGLNRLLAGTGLVARATSSGYVLAAIPMATADDGSGSGSAAASGRETTLNTVEVRAASAEEALKDQAFRSAGSSSYLSRDDIERSRGSSVGDIFRGTTGVLVGENRNSGGLDVNIRGMQGQGRVPILVDGARQETTVYRGYSGVASRSYIDPDLIGGIQIDKGPTLSAQGTGATGGLVSMRTLNADDIVRPGQSTGLRLRGQAIGNNTGSPMESGTPTGLYTGGKLGASPVYRTNCVTASICSGDYALPTEWGYPDGLNRPGTLDPKSWAGSIAAAKRWEKLDIVAAYAQRRQGNYYAGTHGPTAWVNTSDQRRLPFYTEVRPVIEGASIFQGGERIPGSNYESKTALLKGTTYLPYDQELELSYMRYSSAYSEIMPSQIIRFSNVDPVSQPRNSDVTVDTYTSRYHWNPDAQPLIDLRANLWHTRSVANNNNPADVTLDFDNGEGQKYNRTGLDLSNTSTLRHPAGWGESQLRFGVALQHETARPVVDTNNPTSPGGTDRNGERDEYSAFAAWQYKPTSSIIFDAGLRYTHFKSTDNLDVILTDTTSPYCTHNASPTACDPIPNRNRQSGTAPVVSLSWEPGNRGLQFYGRYAEAYRMPSLFESTQGFSIRAQPDVILRPEHTENREVGVNYLKDGALSANDKLRLKFAYFRNQTRDYLTRTTANLWETGGSENTLANALVMHNIDSATFNGLELSGSYDLGWGFTEFGATRYNKIEICYTGSYRVNTCNNYGIAGSYINNMVPPRWHGNLTLGTRLLDRKLVLGVRSVLMGQRTNAPEYNDDTARSFLRVVPWHAYKTFDFFASYRVNETVSVDFNLDNFTDRYYLDALSLGLIPAPGRTARLAVTLQF